MFKFNFNCDGAGQDAPEASAAAQPDEPSASASEARELGVKDAALRFAEETVEMSAHVRMMKCNVSSDQAASILSLKDVAHNDLIPGQYEGGFKVWEGALDLSQFLIHDWLATDTTPFPVPDRPLPLDGCRVLELGCGHGFPGLVALQAGAHVDFQDYNAEVLSEITIPTVRANWQAWQAQMKPAPSRTPSLPARFFSGDWKAVTAKLDEGKLLATYDLILTAETIYNLDAIRSLLACIRQCLKPGGAALVAAKSYYFGVGGGTREVRALLSQSPTLLVERSMEVEDSGSVQREILVLRRL